MLRIAARIVVAVALIAGAAQAGGGSKGDYRQKTLPVKFFKPNAWGFIRSMEMSGSVWKIAGMAATAVRRQKVRS